MFLKSKRKSKGEAVFFFCSPAHPQNIHLNEIMRVLKAARVGYADLLNDLYYKVKSNKQKQTIEYLTRSANQELALFQTFAQLAQPSNGLFEKIQECFNPNELIQQIVDYLSLYEMEQCCVFEIDSTKNNNSFCDKNRLGFVLLKLLTGIIQNTHDGSIKFRINYNQKIEQTTLLEITIDIFDKKIPTRYFECITHQLCSDCEAEYDLGLIKGFLTELNASLQFCVISKDKKCTNNNKKIKEEASQKQKGCQFKLSLPVIVDRSGRSFLYASSSQGEKLC